MNTQPKSIPERVTNWVRSWLATRKETSRSLEWLAGDGSPRQFFRARTGTTTYVVMSDPDWTFSKDYAAHQAYLTEANLPVPRFLREDPKAGFLAMEDLGDELLQLRILAEPRRRLEWLKEATRLLADLHCRTFPPRKDLPFASRRFDEKKYGEEMAFTFEHLHQKFLGLPPIEDSLKNRIGAFCADLEKISPEVFAHRDYHCRNLLVRDGRLFLIDFQDARLGPPHYDLASLVYDAYVEISDADRGDLYRIYRDRLHGMELARAILWESFGSDVEAIALQRLVKAAGSFASFFTRYGKDTHLPYLLPALRSARRLSAQGKGRLTPYKDLFPLDLWIEKAEAKGC